MAKEDFLEGGFYGKLGQLIGERWKNKRYIKTYTAPSNPRTPLQVANREGFAKATYLAQQAFNVNRGASYWQRDDMTEFSWRVSTARKRLLAGMTDEEALPLYPDGYIADNVITGVSASYFDATNKIVVTSLSPVLTESRNFAVQIHYYEESGNVWFTESVAVTIPSDSTWTFTFDWDIGHEYPAGAWIKADTTDDDGGTKLPISLPETPLTQPHNPLLTFDPTQLSVNVIDDGQKLTIESFDTYLQRNFTFELKISYHNASGTGQNIKTYTITVINGVLQPIEDDITYTFVVDDESVWYTPPLIAEYNDYVVATTGAGYATVDE